MKILLICSGGASTGLIMSKMQAYAKTQNIDLTVRATGCIGNYALKAKSYDCVLVGPQVIHKISEIKEKVDRPLAIIDSNDFASMDVEHIFNQAVSLINEH